MQERLPLNLPPYCCPRALLRVLVQGSVLLGQARGKAGLAAVQAEVSGQAEGQELAQVVGLGWWLVWAVGQVVVAWAAWAALAA